MGSTATPHGIAIDSLGLAGADAIRWAGESGFRGVQLSALLPGLRSFELDDGGRRGVRAPLATAGVAPLGVDFLIPRADWADPARVSRAVDAFGAAVRLSTAIGCRAIAVSLPEQDPTGAAMECVQVAEHAGVRLVHLTPEELSFTWLDDQLDALSIGLETASALAGGLDPLDRIVAIGARLGQLRLSDVDRSGRKGPPATMPGGRLDWRGCLLAASLAPTPLAVVLDPAGWENARHGAVASAEAMEWLDGDAAPTRRRTG